MLLIDADNVSVDVMEQAVAALLAEYGALHVRRAYCNAESALKHQQLFKRLAIKPMVNLAAGKNSTDIALAVDALDLVLAERPDVVVIASSDSDFAPLVSRLREKGCRVRGIGQEGKTGDETLAVYDEFTVLTHRGQRAAPKAKERPARPAKQAAQAKPSRKRAAAPAAVQRAAPPPPTPAPPTPAPPARRPDRVTSILAALPELARGQTVELRVASERLRDAGLLGPRASSTKFFAPVAEHFELLPTAEQPNKVRLRS